MNLPDAHLAVVEERKVRHYLLNAGHPDNGGKAAFFTAAGFTTQKWHELADALRDLATNSPFVGHSISPHGQKFVLEGEIRTPDGRTRHIRSVWIIEDGSPGPRLITAYPAI
jgi:hypothetical protein